MNDQAGEKSVIMAAQESDTDFWALKSMVDECSDTSIHVYEENELYGLLDGNMQGRSAVILSTEFADGRISETIGRIRELDERVPVVAVTSHNSRELERHVRQAGIFYYMVLPATQETVRQVVLSATKLVSS